MSVMHGGRCPLGQIDVCMDTLLTSVDRLDSNGPLIVGKWKREMAES